MIYRVEISEWAQKQLRRLPGHIVRKFRNWVEAVQEDGLEKVRKNSGFHDEPLKGRRLGQRSIRLNKAYRAIYVVRHSGYVEFVSVEEISKHDY